MYPQSKFSGYERGHTQAWQPAQPWPQPPPSVHPAWPQPQGEVQWPPPSLRSVPHLEALSAYQAPAKSASGWKAKALVVAAVFGAGVYARPFLETRLRDLPGDVLVVASYVQLRIPSWVPYVGAPLETSHTLLTAAPHAGIVTSPLPTPRLAPLPTPPAEKAEAPQAASESALAPPPVAEVRAMADDPDTAPVARRHSTKRHAKKPVVHHTRVAMRAPSVVAPVSEAAKEPKEPAAEPAAAVTAVVAKKEPEPAPDSLDGLLRRAVTSSAPLAAKNTTGTNRMRFPDEKAAVPRAPHVAAPAPKPESITGDVTSAAEAAAKASAASAASGPKDHAVALPKMPGKVRVSGDPLEGLSGKEIEGKRQVKPKASRR